MLGESDEAADLVLLLETSEPTNLGSSPRTPVEGFSMMKVQGRSNQHRGTFHSWAVIKGKVPRCWPELGRKSQPLPTRINLHLVVRTQSSDLPGKV